MFFMALKKQYFLIATQDYYTPSPGLLHPASRLTCPPRPPGLWVRAGSETRSGNSETEVLERKLRIGNWIGRIGNWNGRIGNQRSASTFWDRKLGIAGSETSAGSETAGRWSGNQDWHVFARIRMHWQCIPGC